MFRNVHFVYDDSDFCVLKCSNLVDPALTVSFSPTATGSEDPFNESSPNTVEGMRKEFETAMGLSEPRDLRVGTTRM